VKVYLVFVDGIEVGKLRAKSHNAAEKKAAALYPGRSVMVSYTEI
jgi:hypothetical protein